MSKRALVTIKGKKDGLVLLLDDRCSYKDLIHELEEKLSIESIGDSSDPLVSVRVKTGNRYLTDKQRKDIQKIIRDKKNLFVSEIESNVITKAECEERVRQNSMQPVNKMVRSGQVLTIEGDLLLLGDVNPGGKVVASGNVYIMGNLRGIAHAGSDGDKSKVIAASHMCPMQLQIGQILCRSIEKKTENDSWMECAYIDHTSNQIVIDRIQTYFKKKSAATS